MLLRRHGRRKATLAPHSSERAAGDSPEETSMGPHMDADEMNAYAEGQLPGAARARALVHLADCDRCRAIVTNLTLAANVPLEAEEQSAPQLQSLGTSWRSWLAALFAPPVMRYATAALVLLCVVGVAFLVIRQQKRESRQDEPEMVARNNESAGGQSGSAVKPGMVEPQQQSANQASSPAPLASPSGRDAEPSLLKDSKAGPTPALGETATHANRTAQADEAQPKEAVKTEATATTAPAPVSRSETASSEVAARDQSGEDSSLARTTQPAPPAATTPVAGAARAPETSEADKTKQRRKDDVASNYGLSGTSTTSNSARGTARESEETVAVNKPTTTARRRGTARPEAKTEDADKIGRSSGALNGERSVETRSVGGRQFRKQGSAWIDAAYTSGRATVNVRRGSEQYRALVADEPTLRAIAEQLGGEVVVVWKGRAYRIN